MQTTTSRDCHYLARQVAGLLRAKAAVAAAAVFATCLILGCAPSTTPPGGADKPSADKSAAGKAAATASAAGTPSSTGAAAVTPTASGKADAGGWRQLFDGKTLTNWKVTEFDDHGKVGVEDGQLIFDVGTGTLTGVTWAGGEVPRMNYEIVCEARRVTGNDFFCGLTFPYNDTCASFICGGWGGSLTGISSLDNCDAANNETTKLMDFVNGRWYTIRVQVTPNHIAAWIDQEQMVDVDVADRKVGVRFEVEPSQPLGVAAFMTKAAIRTLDVRRLPQ
jgi:hypothetical protein